MNLAAYSAQSLSQLFLLLFRQNCALRLKRARDRTDFLGVGVERVEQVVWNETIEDELASLLAAYQSGILKNRQVLRDGGLRHLEAGRDIASAQLSMCQVREDLTTGRGRQSLEHFLHAPYLRSKLIP